MPKKKTDFHKMMKQYEPVVKKTGEQLSKAMKTAEKDIAKLYKLAEGHVEVQINKLQKEKLYYDIGKDVACKITKGGLSDADMEKYKKKLSKIEAEATRRKKALSQAGKKTGKKTAKKK
ncbi:hypothetical protein ACFL5E_02795 [Candidatus Omnitrophota bacterium]